jgi:hypothetical protein
VLKISIAKLRMVEEERGMRAGKIHANYGVVGCIVSKSST